MVFQGGAADVFSTAIGPMFRRKGRGREITEAAVRPDFVVVLPHSRRRGAGREQIPEKVWVKVFVPELAVEALGPAILRGFAWRDVEQLDAVLMRPCQKVPTGKFRTIVQSQARRVAAFGRDQVEHARYPPAGEAGIDLQPKAFPRERLADDQPSDLPGELQNIVNKIQRPLLVGRCPRHQRLALAHKMLPFSAANRQTAFPVQPMHPLVV